MRDEHPWPELDSDSGTETDMPDRARRGSGADRGDGTEPAVHAAERTDEMPAVPTVRVRPDRQATSHSAHGAAEDEVESTQQMSTVPLAAGSGAGSATGPASGSEDPTVRTRHRTGEPAAAVPPDAPEGQRRRRKPLLIGAVVFGLLALLYVGDLLLSSGKVPRGVTVAGVAIGGLSSESAESQLRAALEPRLTQPVTLQAGDVRTQLEPESSGLGIDWAGTLEQAGDQPLNPITRITSFFTNREVGTVSKVDRAALTTAVNDRRGELETEPREGNIKFTPAAGQDGQGGDGEVIAAAVPPRPGQQADVTGAVDAIAEDWLQAGPVQVPVDRQPVRTTNEGVQTALEKVAKPAVAGPLLVRGDGADATLRPVEISRALSFTPGDGGGLRMRIDAAKLTEAAKPQLAQTEQQGRDAKVVFTGGAPTVRPGTEGRAVAWKKTFEPAQKVLALTGDKRQLKAHYHKQPPNVTTKEAGGLGIKEVIGEFTTSDFASDSGVNIRQVAEEVDGAIVKPGQTFSLNDYTGPRTEAEGYVPAGIIEDGVPSRAVGGGISQFATTLFNASYFAGMTDAGHQEHSYYISRYPVAREATVYQAADGEIDLAFTNDAPTGVAIQTIWTPSDITVRIWGTKRYRVESITGEKKNFVPPGTERGKPGVCEPSEGVPGFTATDTRVLYDINSGSEVGRNTREVTYNPEPKIVCK